MEITPIAPDIGATIRIDPADILSDGAPDRIMAALNRYNVVVFPQIHLSDDQFLALTNALGESDEQGARLKSAPDDAPRKSRTDDGSAASAKGIYRIALDKDDKTQRDFIRGNDFWHMDGTAYAAPGKATLLKCESAPHAGGDTGIANLFAAYAALPEAKKRALEGLRVVHCLASVGVKFYEQPTPEDFARWDGVFPPREHPLVWHQRDGRTALLIGSTARDIVGMAHPEGAALIDELLDWSTADRFVYRHAWRAGDLVIFNNPGCLHRSFPYGEGAGRVMHRTTLKGLELTA